MLPFIIINETSILIIYVFYGHGFGKAYFLISKPWARRVKQIQWPTRSTRAVPEVRRQSLSNRYAAK